MDLLSMSRMPFSADSGWTDLERDRPGVARLLAELVLPLSLVTPAVLYVTGASGALDPIAGPRDWAAVAFSIFIAQLASVVVMAWLIREVTATFDRPLDTRRSWMLAAVAAVPLWLSSLGVALPGIGWPVAVGLAGFALCCALLYQGLRALCRDLDELAALGIVQIVVGVPLTGWGLLYVFALV